MRSGYDPINGDYSLGDYSLSHEATELVLYAQNDYGNYKAYIVPMLKACQKHYDKGNGDYERVIAGFTRVFLPIARNYVLEHCGMTDSVRALFPPSVRRECGRHMAEYFLAEYHANGGGWS
jgi:hypothetical protein